MLTPIFLSDDLSTAEQQDLTRFLSHPESFKALNPRGDETQVWARESGALVFKVFAINRFRQRWRARWKRECSLHGKRFGWAERSNAERFHAMGLPGIGVRAYLEKRSALLCSQQIVAYPYLRNFQTLHQRLQQHHPFTALETVVPVMLRLAQAGVFHLDLNTRNIMLDDQGQVRIIDFEYMAWEQSRTGEMFSYSLGYLFQKWAREFIDEAAYDHWAHSILQRHTDLFTAPAPDLLSNYTLGKQIELSRAKRYRIFA